MGTILTSLLALLFLPLPVLAQVSIDPCEMQVAKQPFNATISSATVTKLVTGQTGKTIHLCGLKVENVGSSPTWKLTIGTNTSTVCDTGAKDLTPAFGGANTAVATAGNGNTVMGFGQSEVLDTGAPGADLCLTSGGTITDIWVYGSYVVQ